LSLIDQLLKKVSDIPDDKNLYLVIYSTGKKPPKEFYHQLRRLSEHQLVRKIGMGVLLCRGRRSVALVKKLIDWYGRKKRKFRVVRIFRVLEEVM